MDDVASAHVAGPSYIACGSAWCSSAAAGDGVDRVAAVGSWASGSLVVATSTDKSLQTALTLRWVSRRRNHRWHFWHSVRLLGLRADDGGRLR